MDQQRASASSIHATCAIGCLPTNQAEDQPLPGGIHSVILLDSNKLPDDMASETGLDHLISNEFVSMCSVCLNPLLDGTAIIETECKVNHFLTVVNVFHRDKF